MALHQFPNGPAPRSTRSGPDVDTTISEAFSERGSDTIDYRGRIVKAVVRIPVADGAVITVTRRRALTDRPQAIKLAVNSGLLVVNGQRAPAVALWSNTSPSTVELTVDGSGASTVDVWNAWSMGGVDTSWVGNAGMVTKATSGGTVLRCSDGIGPAEFSDLEVNVSVQH